MILRERLFIYRQYACCLTLCLLVSFKCFASQVSSSKSNHNPNPNSDTQLTEKRVYETVTSPSSTAIKTLVVSLHGLPKNEENQVLASLSIKAAEKEKKLNENRIESLHQLAIPEITTTIEALGYYDSHVRGALVPVPGGYRAEYWVTLNSPTTINSVTVQLLGEGKDDLKLKALAEHPSLIAGTILKHNVYESYKQTLLSQALQLGFLNAQFESNEIQVNQDTRQAEIILILNTGHQYRMGAVTFKDLPYPSDYLERHVRLKPDAPYTTENLNKLQKNLTETELFKYVRLEPQLEDSDDYIVPVKVRLKPRPHNRFFGGGGYGTDTGMRGMLGWERRRQNYPGHKINTTIKASQRFNQFNLRYTIPGSHPATDRLIFGFRVTEETQRDKKYSRRGDVSITQIKKMGEVERILDVNYLAEVYRELQATPKDRSQFLIPSASLVWTHVTQSAPKQFGFQLGATVRGGAGTTAFGQGELRFKWIAPLGEESRLLMRSQLATTAVKNFERIPLSLRYFAGGDLSVRGYGYQTLGPREMDPLGNLVVVGARNLAVGSLEVERTIYKQFSIAAFADTGNAMNGWKSRLYSGGGFGIRYATPLGPFRVDIARPILSGKQRLRLHLTFGMDL